MRGCISRPAMGNMSPLLRHLCVARHIPLGLNAASISKHMYASIVGAWFPRPRVINMPTPTGSGVCDNTTLRSSGARPHPSFPHFGCVAYCYRHVAPLGLCCKTVRCIIAFYKHVAPLGLNAPVLLSSNGLGNPTPTSSDHYIKKPLINQPHRDNITGIRKGVLTFCLSPIRQVL